MYPGIFTPINFASRKHEMGLALMNQLANAEKQFPKDQADIAQDYFALRKTYQGNRWRFSEGRNMLLPSSHCDIAWAGGLSSEADGQQDTWGGGRGAFSV